MTADDLDKRAELTIWLEAGTGQTRQGREFATLREALCAAVDVSTGAEVSAIMGFQNSLPGGFDGDR